MDGFTACRYYLAIKLHFTQKKFNIFELNTRQIKYPITKYILRPDVAIFEKLTKLYSDKNFIRLIASNFMYNYPNVLYDSITGEQNLQEYNKRRESITRVFTNDLQEILENGGLSFEIMIRLYLGSRITIETCSILNDLIGILDQRHKTPFLDFMQNDILRIRKAKGFVIYDRNKIENVFNKYRED